MMPEAPIAAGALTDVVALALGAGGALLCGCMLLRAAAILRDELRAAARRERFSSLTRPAWPRTGSMHSDKENAHDPIPRSEDPRDRVLL